MSEIEPVAVMEDGWTEWLHPISPFRMKCCDCGLIHELEFAIVQPNADQSSFNDGEGAAGVIIFRGRRHETLSEDGKIHQGAKT